MKIILCYRHLGVHEPIKEADVAGVFGDYAKPGGDRDAYVIDEGRLLAALPDGFLPVPAGRVLLTVEDDTGATGQTGLEVFRDWAKYFDAYSLTLRPDGEGK